MPNGQEQQQQQQPASKLPQVNYLAVPNDDYVYEAVPLPMTTLEEETRAAQAGGMSKQNEIISSGVDNNF